MVTVSTMIAYQHSHHLFSKSPLWLIQESLTSTLDLSSFWSQFSFQFPVGLHGLQFSCSSFALMKRELSFKSKFSKTFGLTSIYTFVTRHLNILQGRRAKHSLLAILPSTIAWIILDFTCIPYSHCSHISIEVSVKPVAGLEQALIILQFNRETDYVKWEVSNIFLEHISKFTRYASLPFTGIFIVCLF